MVGTLLISSYQSVNDHSKLTDGYVICIHGPHSFVQNTDYESKSDFESKTKPEKQNKKNNNEI